MTSFFSPHYKLTLASPSPDLHLLRSPANSIHVKSEANTHHIRSYPPWTLNNIFSHFIHLSFFFICTLLFNSQLSPEFFPSLSLSPPSSAWMMCDVICVRCGFVGIKWKTESWRNITFGRKMENFPTQTHTLIFTICRVKLETWKEDFPTSAERLFVLRLSLQSSYIARHSRRRLPFASSKWF